MSKTEEIKVSKGERKVSARNVLGDDAEPEEARQGVRMRQMLKERREYE